MIDQLVRQGYRVITVCEVRDYPRSTYYHPAPPVTDDAVRAAIRAVVGAWPRYGYRRVTAELRRRGLPVNHKRMQRLMQLMNLQRKIKAKKRRTTNSQHAFPRYPNLVQDLVVIRSDQVWVCDITYIAL